MWKSNYTKFLEAELERVRTESASTIEQLKTAHAAELNRAIDNVQYHREEIERLRRFLLPGIQPVYEAVRDASSPSAPPEKDPYAGLTPYQRMVAKDLAEQDKAIAEQKQKKAESGTAN